MFKIETRKTKIKILGKIPTVLSGMQIQAHGDIKTLALLKIDKKNPRFWREAQKIELGVRPFPNFIFGEAERRM